MKGNSAYFKSSNNQKEKKGPNQFKSLLTIPRFQRETPNYQIAVRTVHDEQMPKPSDTEYKGLKNTFVRPFSGRS